MGFKGPGVTCLHTAGAEILDLTSSPGQGLLGGFLHCSWCGLSSLVNVRQSHRLLSKGLFGLGD